MHNVIGSFEIGVMIDETRPVSVSKKSPAKASARDILKRLFAGLGLNY